MVTIKVSRCGALIEIMADGKVACSMTAQSRTQFQALGAGEVGDDSFTYVIRLASVSALMVSDCVSYDAALMEKILAGVIQSDSAPGISTSGLVTAAGGSRIKNGRIYERNVTVAPA